MSRWACPKVGGNTYGFDLMWQWVDITGLPAGTYKLTGHVDANHYFLQSTRANDCASAIIQIGPNGTSINVLSTSPALQPC